MNPDELMNKKADRWDALVAQGISPAEATQRVEREFGPVASKAPAIPKMAAESTAAPARPAAAKPTRERQPLAEALPAAVANVARQVPGAEPAMALARSVARRQPYSEALGDIRGAVERLPAAVRVPTGMAGGALATAAMPGHTIARQAAAYGAGMAAAEASPEVGLAERAVRAPVQGALSGILGKAMDVGGTAVRARFVPTAEQTLLKQRAAQVAASEPKYTTFRELGDLADNIATEEQLERTADIIGLPVVRRAIDLVRSESPRLKDLADTDAQVLDAVYKKLGKKAFRADGFETAEAKRALGSVMDELSGGAYSAATKPFEAGAKQIAATERTAGMVAAGQRPSKATLKSAQARSMEALPEFVRGASEEEKRAAMLGALGELRQFGLSDLLQPFSYGVKTGLSLVPGVRRTIRASDIVNAIEGQVAGARTPVGRMATARGARELGRRALTSYPVPIGPID